MKILKTFYRPPFLRCWQNVKKKYVYSYVIYSICGTVLYYATMVSISKPLPKFFPRIYESQLNDKILFIKVKRPIFRKKMTFVRGKSFYKKEYDITSM